MLSNVDTFVEVYEPRSTEPSFEIPGEAVESFDFDERIGRRKDTGSLVLTNDYGEFTDEIRSGQRIDVRIEFGIPNEDERWNERWDEPFSEYIWPGKRLVWSALVRDDDINRESWGRAHLTAQLEDFALGVLAKREVYSAFDDWPVHAIIQRLFDEYAPELTVSMHTLDGIGLTETTSASWNGQSMFDVIDDLLSRTNAVLRVHGENVHIRPFTAPDPKFTALAAEDYGTTDRHREDDNLTNVYRVDGPTDRRLDESATNEERDGWYTVREDVVVHFQIPTRKSQVASIGLWTDFTGEGSVLVRLQRDDDGGPVAAHDRASDIASVELSHEFIGDDNWTEFILPDHTLPEANPRVLIEVNDGSLDFAVDSQDRTTRRVYFPLPITAVDRDTGSVARYRERHGSAVKNDASVDEARDEARAALARNSTPDKFVTTAAESRRMHALRPGEVIEMQYDRDGINGQYMLIERTNTLSASTVETDLTLQEVISL